MKRLAKTLLYSCAIAVPLCISAMEKPENPLFSLASTAENASEFTNLEETNTEKPTETTTTTQETTNTSEPLDPQEKAVEKRNAAKNDKKKRKRNVVNPGKEEEPLEKQLRVEKSPSSKLSSPPAKTTNPPSKISFPTTKTTLPTAKITSTPSARLEPLPTHSEMLSFLEKLESTSDIQILVNRDMVLKLRSYLVTSNKILHQDIDQITQLKQTIARLQSPNHLRNIPQGQNNTQSNYILTLEATLKALEKKMNEADQLKNEKIKNLVDENANLKEEKKNIQKKLTDLNNTNNKLRHDCQWSNKEWAEKEIADTKRDFDKLRKSNEDQYEKRILELNYKIKILEEQYDKLIKGLDFKNPEN